MRKCLAEFVGTAILVIVGCGSVAGYAKGYNVAVDGLGQTGWGVTARYWSERVDQSGHDEAEGERDGEKTGSATGSAADEQENQQSRSRKCAGHLREDVARPPLAQVFCLPSRRKV